MAFCTTLNATDDNSDFMYFLLTHSAVTLLLSVLCCSEASAKFLDWRGLLTGFVDGVKVSRIDEKLGRIGRLCGRELVLKASGI